MPAKSVKEQLTEKVLSVQSPPEHYTADFCGFICADDRLWDATDAFKRWFEKSGRGRIEMIRVFGGAKAFAGGPSEERNVFLGQMKSSMQLHGTAGAILVFQIDCGAYGGSRMFGNVEDTEYQHHIADYHAAEKFLKGEIPGINVEGWIVASDGFYRIK